MMESVFNVEFLVACSFGLLVSSGLNIMRYAGDRLTPLIKGKSKRHEITAEGGADGEVKTIMDELDREYPGIAETDDIREFEKKILLFKNYKKDTWAVLLKAVCVTVFIFIYGHFLYGSRWIITLFFWGQTVWAFFRWNGLSGSRTVEKTG
jgi:hypothetical protein